MLNSRNGETVHECKYIIIRGPAASGKTTVAKLIAQKLNAKYVSFDDIMQEHSLDVVEGDGISAKNFLIANEFALNLLSGDEQYVFFDGCFYRKEQLDHLRNRLGDKIIIFTLRVPLQECLLRNIERNSPMPQTGVKEVFDLVNSLKVGIDIFTMNKTPEDVAMEIISSLQRIP